MKSIFFILSLFFLGNISLTAQSFTGKVMKTVKPPVPFYQANVEIKAGDKPVKVLKTYYDGTFSFSPDRNQTYSVKISSPGYIDSIITFTTNKKAMPEPASANITLKKDGMRLFGQVRNKKENFPLKGVTLVLKNIMTRKPQRITTDVDGNFNFKIELETNYSFTVDKHSPGVANKYKDTTIYITTLGMYKPVDLKMNLFLPSYKPGVINKHKAAQQAASSQQNQVVVSKKYSKRKPEKGTKSSESEKTKKQKKTKEAPTDIVVIRDIPATTPTPVEPPRPAAPIAEKPVEKKPEKLSKKELAARQKFIADSITNAINMAAQQAIQDSVTRIKAAQEKAERELVAKKQREDSIIKANLAAQQKKLIQDSIAIANANKEKLEKELATKKLYQDSIAKISFIAQQKKRVEDSISAVKATAIKEKADKELAIKKFHEDSIAKVILIAQQKKLIQDSIATVKAKALKEKAERDLAAKKFHQDSIAAAALIEHQKKLIQDSIKTAKAIKDKLEKEIAAKKFHEDSIALAQRKKIVQDSISVVKAKAAKEKMEKELAVKKLREDSITNAALVARQKKLLQDSIKVAAANKVLTVATSAENPPVFFNKNSFTIPDTAAKQLEDIAHLLATNASWNVRVHSLASADETDPPQLLLKRSNAVVEYLLKAGIQLKQIEPLYSAAGKSRNGCTSPTCPEEQLRQNRCVVYEIIKK